MQNFLVIAIVPITSTARSRTIVLGTNSLARASGSARWLTLVRGREQEFGRTGWIRGIIWVVNGKERTFMNFWRQVIHGVGKGRPFTAAAWNNC